MPFYIEQESIFGYKKRLDFFLRQIERRYGKRSASVIDVGCGNGAMVSLPLAEKGHSVLGIDLDERSIRRAQEANRFPNASFRVAKSSDILGETFNVVICSEVLEHIEDCEDVIADLRRLCKPDGIALITVPNGYGPFEIDSWLAKRTKQIKLPDAIRKPISKWIRKQHKDAGAAPTENLESPHVRFFTMKQIRQAIEKHFEIAETQKSVFACGPFATMLFGKSQKFAQWNAKVADALPYWLASGWYFACEPKSAMTDARKKETEKAISPS